MKKLGAVFILISLTLNSTCLAQRGGFGLQCSSENHKTKSEAKGKFRSLSFKIAALTAKTQCDSIHASYMAGHVSETEENKSNCNESFCDFQPLPTADLPCIPDPYYPPIYKVNSGDDGVPDTICAPSPECFVVDDDGVITKKEDGVDDCNYNCELVPGNTVSSFEEGWTVEYWGWYDQQESCNPKPVAH